MTGRIDFTPEAVRQRVDLDDWITKAASADVARQFLSADLGVFRGGRNWETAFSDEQVNLNEDR